MCGENMKQFLKELPKCEHHIHIEGSLSPALLFELAKTNNIALPDTETDASFKSPEELESRYERFTSLNDFLHYYYIGMSVLINAADYESLAYEYLTKANRDGVHHAEIFFDPQAHTERGIAYKTVVEGLTAGLKRAEKDFVSLGHFSNGTVAAIGLDSSEVGFPPEIFREIYESAEGKGIHRTSHAGEEGDTSYISRALDICKVERIDHGIRLAEDESLLKRVAEQGTMLTVCPLSNVRLRCVENVGQLPIRKFLDAGIKFSINSDDPAYFGGYILDNYVAVQEAFELSLKEWKYIATSAIEGSWCDDERKSVLLSKVDACVNKHEALI
ncbi:hypothetical protein BOTCAL_0274g00090 [Botryotinia calthae]|uniref:Adenine deaminase n=1 Tax=Botryotinia calthae TaxID=38488 RepID=A0A4Y8CVK5_9HELO|nr:hypothetical protein BOTCAL_0274g00090 [Botryotinia calthae]